MIGYLEGIIKSAQEKSIIINVSGVGYLIYPSPEVLKKDLQVGNNISLFIHTHVREDQITLYGFNTQKELELFELLITVSGIGPKTALNVLSAGNVEDIKMAVANADVDFFQQVTGIGKKSAQRIIVDLKNKIGGLKELDLSDKNLKQYQDLISALRSMGFESRETREAIKKVDSKLPLDKQIKQALKHL